MLWHCWKSIRPVKIERWDVSVVICLQWDADMVYAYGPADATAIPKPHHLLPHLNPDWFNLSSTSLPRLSWKRSRLNWCSVAALSLSVICQSQTPGYTTHTQPFNGIWSGTTQVGRYQKKHSPTHTHPDHRTSFINFLHVLRSIASSLFSWRAWQSSLTTSLQVLFGLPPGLGPFTSYSTHFFTQSSSSFRLHKIS